MMTTYCRQRLITGGTFTAGAVPPNDWSAQFDTGSIALAAIPSTAGEFATDSLTCGICCDFCVKSANPCDLSVWIEASAGVVLQVNVNGVITEVPASALITISLTGGYNVIRFVRAAGPIVVSGKFWDGVTAEWFSLYLPGFPDPFIAGSGGGGVGPSFGSGGTTG